MKTSRSVVVGVLLTAVWLSALSCGDPSEAPRVELPLVVDASGVGTVTTDLGYEVELSEVRVVIRDVLFTIAGEAHTASLWRGLSEALLPRAHAHPGHYQGGDVTGELPGLFVVDWLGEEGRELGVATLIAGTYTAANFTFERGSADTLPPGDPLIGHTALLSGTASKSGQQVRFTVVIDSPEGRTLVGAPFEAQIGTSASGRLLFRFETRDPLEGDTFADGIDFFELNSDSDGVVRIDSNTAETEEAYNVIRRTFQTHDHYAIRYQE